MLKKMALMGMGVLLASCATAEFMEEEGICSATWTNKIPPRYEQEMYNAMQKQTSSNWASFLHNKWIWI